MLSAWFFRSRIPKSRARWSSTKKALRETLTPSRPCGSVSLRSNRPPGRSTPRRSSARASACLGRSGRRSTNTRARRRPRSRGCWAATSIQRPARFRSASSGSPNATERSNRSLRSTSTEIAPRSPKPWRARWVKRARSSSSCLLPAQTGSRERLRARSRKHCASSATRSFANSL